MRIDNLWFIAAFPLCKKALGVFFACMVHERVGEGQDGLCGPVILFQFNYFCVGKSFWKVQHVSEIGAPKGIYGLGIITDHHDILMFVGKPFYNVRLNAVGILVFIDHDIGIPFTEFASNGAVFH